MDRWTDGKSDIEVGAPPKNNINILAYLRLTHAILCMSLLQMASGI